MPIRETGKPYFLECRTYLLRAHSMFDAQLYRDKAEVEAWRRRGPSCAFADGSRRQYDHPRTKPHRGEVAAEIAAAVAFAEADLGTGRGFNAPCLCGACGTVDKREGNAGGIGTYVVPIVRRPALGSGMRSLARSARVPDGRGCRPLRRLLWCVQGLDREFGPERSGDTPLSEGGCTGAGIGAGMKGMRPIVETMTVNFSLLALDQIVNKPPPSATCPPISSVCRGQPPWRLAPAGSSLAQHSHSLEGWFAHIPGLKVLTPATLEDARGMFGRRLKIPIPYSFSSIRRLQR